MDTPQVVSLNPHRLTWDSAVRLFLLRCRSQNHSPRTQQLYAEQLGYFRSWLGANGDPQPADTSAEHLRLYLEARRSNGAGSGTVDINYRLLKTFWRFLERDGLILVNAMTRVERPRRERRLIRPFTEEELRKVLEKIDTRQAVGLRDYALILLLVDTGLRISEALGLKLSDVEWAAQSIVVLGKGRRERRVFFGQTARRALDLWLERRGRTDPDGLVWLGRLGDPLPRNAFQHRLKAYTRAAGIAANRLSPHALRHTFAVQFLRNGGDVLTLQRLLGHSSLDMVRAYVSLTDADTFAAHRRASPLDKMGPLPNERKRVRLT